MNGFKSVPNCNINNVVIAHTKIIPSEIHHIFSSVIVCKNNLTTFNILYKNQPIQYMHVSVSNILIRIFSHFGIPHSLINLYINFTYLSFRGAFYTPLPFSTQRKTCKTINTIFFGCRGWTRTTDL